ncbi:hypothetical protein [Actinoalloteichus hymeniacidonis]|uniref:Secreted protein n=1 Tax=Actinoalloteichus hymeniacidonis TaxID=340345 RepID=A0AAC9MX07_9PSEU|nr:hypothetical protein [Actinoalloteichus hymeniacidonis]AOS61382.1 hypothetical protein TL08_02720 [Actinoalloteichus hymeniacidonis]MBB5910613.1 hypothetical protein [Actinoalloteichus hymeniacidonis]
MKISARRSLRNALLVLPLAVLLTGACGGGEEESSPAPDAGNDAASGGTEQAGTDDELEEWGLNFRSCMRDAGIDMPEPEGGMMEAPSADIISSDAFIEADEACREEFGEPPMAEGGLDPEERHEENLRIASCFRENGVDVPDPAPGEMLTIDLEIPEDVFEACDVQGLPTGAGS